MNNDCKEFAARIGNLYVEHPKIKSIWSRLDAIRQHRKLISTDDSPRHIFVLGESGVGKSRMAKRYANKNQCSPIKYEDGTECDIKPVLYLELPDPFTIAEFYQSIVKALGAPQLIGSPKIGEIKRQAFTLLDKQKVEMILIDEMNYILTSKRVSIEEAMEALKHVSNTSKVSLVCIGTPETEVLQTQKFQYFRRYPVTRLERFKECNQEFCEFLDDIEQQIRPLRPIGLGNKNLKFPQLLFHFSRGIVGLITPTIQEAYRLLGVFEEDFNDMKKAYLTANEIAIAYKNIVGDLTFDELDKMIGRL